MEILYYVFNYLAVYAAYENILCLLSHQIQIVINNFFLKFPRFYYMYYYHHTRIFIQVYSIVIICDFCLNITIREDQLSLNSMFNEF